MKTFEQQRCINTCSYTKKSELSFFIPSSSYETLHPPPFKSSRGDGYVFARDIKPLTECKNRECRKCFKNKAFATISRIQKQPFK